MTPTEYFAKQVKVYRRQRDWTQPELARRCQAAGLDWDRSIVANVEGGRRASVTVHEVFALAHVLSVAPALLLFPVMSGEPVEVADGLSLHPGLALRWFVGEDGPFDPAADRPAFERDALPLRLYSELGRAHEVAIWFERRIRAQESVHGKDSIEAVNARRQYADRLGEFVGVLVRMAAIGMAPPPVERVVHDDAERFGLELPKSVGIREESADGR